jgi:hypothetical protein
MSAPFKSRIQTARLLRALGDGREHTPDELCAALGITRNALRTYVTRTRAAGHAIVSIFGSRHAYILPVDPTRIVLTTSAAAPSRPSDEAIIVKHNRRKLPRGQRRIMANEVQWIEADDSGCGEPVALVFSADCDDPCYAYVLKSSGHLVPEAFFAEALQGEYEIEPARGSPAAE